MRDLEAVLREVLPDGGRALLVGNSLGGGIILAHAHEFGDERVAGVVFAGSGGSGVTFAGFPARGMPVWAQAALRSGWLRVLRTTALVGRRIKSVETLSDHLVRRFAFTPRTPPGPVAHVRDSFLSSRPNALARTTLASVSHDGRTLAPELRVPTLVLHGSDDPEVPAQELRDLLAALPDAELVSLPGKGHVLALTDPEFVAEHVAGWVRRVGLARGELRRHSGSRSYRTRTARSQEQGGRPPATTSGASRCRRTRCGAGGRWPAAARGREGGSGQGTGRDCSPELRCGGEFERRLQRAGFERATTGAGAQAFAEDYAGVPW